MAGTYRIGIHTQTDDVFWVLVGEAIEYQCRQSGIELISLDIDDPKPPQTEYASIIESILAQDLDAFITQELSRPLIDLITEHDLPVISLVEKPSCYEQNCNHPLLISPIGLYQVAQIMSEYLLERLEGKGNVLVVGGMAGFGEEDGRSRLASIYNSFAPYDSIEVCHIPTSWRHNEAYPQIMTAAKNLTVPPAALFGLSDTLALLAREILEELGLITPGTIVVGINGEPQAFAAIAGGTMAATVETSAADFGNRLVELALRAATGQDLPMHFSYPARLITVENVAEIASQNLMAIARLPNRLVGVNRRREQQRLTQLETSLAINRQVGAILDRQELTRTIVNLIQSNYKYDRVQLFLWSETAKTFVLDNTGSITSDEEKISAAGSGVLSQVLRTGEPVFIPDMRYSQRFPRDERWPQLRSRAVLPLRLGGNILGVLDLHRDTVTHHSLEQLLGLQQLTDQLAIAIRNAELYCEALEARKAAEKADRLKTRLLANVSHELRTPLNIILGYTKGALEVPNPYDCHLPDELLADLGHVYRSGEHLTHLINDLLDLSRAEIDELEIFPELLDLGPFLEEVFHSLADINSGSAELDWRLQIPSQLPLLQADPVRLRQILLNLLSNARKFTRRGRITLGAEIAPPYVHIWVEDTGSGVAPELQERIFEPFVVGDNSARSRGIGLGLSITRRLVRLHRGEITLESEEGKGTTFHLRFPLPNLSGQLIAIPPSAQQVMVFISNRSNFPPEIAQFKALNNLCLCPLTPGEVPGKLIDLNPTILVWDAPVMEAQDWWVMDYMRNTPQIAQLPLVLFGNIQDKNGPSGITNVMLKPLAGRTLKDLLETLKPNLSRGRVLIVDDDPASLDLYNHWVAEALPGYKIHLAGSGRIALALLKELVPDMVIIDLAMPEVDGFEVIEWLRANPPTQNVPVLVISGKVLSAEDIERLDFGRIVFHSKNMFHPEETTEAVQQVLEGANLLPQYNSMLVKRVVSYLQHNFTRSLSLQEIARVIGVSKNYLGEIFHQELGISPWDYLSRYRVKEAKRLLATTDQSITEIAARVGFDDPAYFSRVFRDHTGMSPKAFRNNPV